MKSLIVVVLMLLAVPCFAINGEVGIGYSVVDMDNSDIPADDTSFVRVSLSGDYGMLKPYADIQINLDDLMLNTQSREVKLGGRYFLNQNMFIDGGYKIERYPSDQNVNTVEIYGGYRF